jgi:hypothetical protein
MSVIYMSEGLIKIVPLALPIVALIFHAGQQSEKIVDLYTRMDIEHNSTREILHGIENKLTVIEQDIKQILRKTP